MPTASVAKLTSPFASGAISDTERAAGAVGGDDARRCSVCAGSDFHIREAGRAGRGGRSLAHVLDEYAQVIALDGLKQPRSRLLDLHDVPCGGKGGNRRFETPFDHMKRCAFQRQGRGHPQRVGRGPAFGK